jgi:ketosteroid isomerase-like protein
MAKPTADEFIAALRQCEDAGNVDALAALYADDARTANPTDRDPHEGADGARRFWEAYRKSFATIHSRFHSILEGEDKAMLEWTSDCETAAGVKTSYDGVSVFETRGGKITRFTAYFDPAELNAGRTESKHAGVRGEPDAGAYGATRGGVESGADAAAEQA